MKAFLLGEDCYLHRISDLEHTLKALHYKLKDLVLNNQCKVLGIGTC